MQEVKRKIKCWYVRIKHYFGSLVCSCFGCKLTVGFATTKNTFKLLDFCPRCGKVSVRAETPICGE